jgi:hypothetical protein
LFLLAEIQTLLKETTSLMGVMQELNAIILLYPDKSLVEYVSTEKCVGNP